MKLLHLACWALLFASCEDTAESEPPQRPNILFAIADDASYPHMGAYGTDWVTTPAFDRVAREGLLFERAYTPNAKCSPSRSCILTGRNSWSLEQLANHWPRWPQQYVSVVEVLERNGYTVGHTAKGWAPGKAGQIDGRRRLLTGPGYNDEQLQPPTDAISANDYAANFKSFLDGRDDERPFFFWYGSTEPHRAYEYGSGLNLTDRRLADIDEVPAFWPDNDSVRTDMLDYAYEIDHFDRHLGRMLDELERRGELSNTLVVVTADNGMPFPRVKGQAYEMSNHLPLAIMWADGIERPGRSVEDFVSFIDFAPTFLAVAGVEADSSDMPPIQGRPLQPLFSGSEVAEFRSHVLIGKERHDIGRPDDVGYPIRGIVSGDYLYLHNYAPERWPAGNPETGYLNTDGSATKSVLLNARRNDTDEASYWQLNFGKRPAEEVYDIRNDPYCLTNLIDDANLSTQIAALRERMESELANQGDPRMAGNGEVFDDYPYTGREQDFYNRYMAGEKMSASWVEESDFEGEPLD